MAVKHDAVVDELRFKIEKLVKLYILSLEQNTNLESKIQELQSELGDVQKEKLELDNKLKITKVANAISGGDENSSEAKIRINKLVREIDKCIALLNN